MLGLVMPAAGTGSRMGGVRKPFLELGGEPLLRHALRPFLEHPDFRTFVLALREEDVLDPPGWVQELGPGVRLVKGGSSRGESVWAALQALPSGLDLVAVHDAARPLVTRAIIDGCIAAAGPGRGAVAGMPAVDTVKQVAEGGRISGTLQRSAIWHAQTPQVFPLDLIMEAYRRASRDGVENTDDSALVERIGGEVVMAAGAASNIKVTRTEDLALAEFYLQAGTGG